MNDVALLVAMPTHHLESAAVVHERQGRVVLPAGGPGDLPNAEHGAPVLLVAARTDPEEQAAPAATWRARFVRVVPHEDGNPLPDLLPPTWVAERMAHSTSIPVPASPDDDPEDEEQIGPQSFFEVDALAPLERSEWVFTNELVPKQERKGRAFIPRVPRLVRLPI